MNHSLKHLTILAIDDAPSILAFLRISMEAMGATFVEADTAQKGLDMVAQTAPDLVVLDLGLPDRDGLDILPEIKAAAGAPEVIVLSVRKDRDIIARAHTLGADEYLTKPFTMNTLMDAISTRLNHGQAGNSAPTSH